MKSPGILVVLSLICFIDLYSQVLDRTVVEKTPWGANVTTYINFEAKASDRQAGDDYYRDDTDGTYIYTYPPYSSTDKFNCHGYAWYMSDAAGGTGHLDPSVSLLRHGSQNAVRSRAS